MLPPRKQETHPSGALQLGNSFQWKRGVSYYTQICQTSELRRLRWEAPSSLSCCPLFWYKRNQCNKCTQADSESYLRQHLQKHTQFLSAASIADGTIWQAALELRKGRKKRGSSIYSWAKQRVGLECQACWPPTMRPGGNGFLPGRELPTRARQAGLS